MVSPVARGFSCRTEGCWTEIEEGFFSLLDPFSILLTQRLTAVGISVSARLLLWEEVWSVEDIALSGSQPDAASVESLPPELPVPLETHSSVCFPCSSSFQCHIPYLQNSASSPALFPPAPNESCLPEPQLTLEKGEVLVTVCSGGCVFNRALHSVAPWGFAYTESQLFFHLVNL